MEFYQISVNCEVNWATNWQLSSTMIDSEMLIQPPCSQSKPLFYVFDCLSIWKKKKKTCNKKFQHPFKSYMATHPKAWDNVIQSSKEIGSSAWVLLGTTIVCWSLLFLLMITRCFLFPFTEHKCAAKPVICAWERTTWQKCLRVVRLWSTYDGSWKSRGTLSIDRNQISESSAIVIFFVKQCI